MNLSGVLPELMEAWYEVRAMLQGEKPRGDWNLWSLISVRKKNKNNGLGVKIRDKFFFRLGLVNQPLETEPQTNIYSFAEIWSNIRIWLFFSGGEILAQI